MVKATKGLYARHAEENLTPDQIAEMLGCTRDTVTGSLRRYKIQVRHAALVDASVCADATLVCQCWLRPRNRV